MESTNLQISKSTKIGFTLIELLVVISIIGILAAIALVSFSTAQKQARDTERKSDLKQYQTSLETFANKAGTYPSYTVKVDPANPAFCTVIGITGNCPTDPNKSQTYNYISDGTGGGTSNAVNYVLWASLENASGSYYVICSSGKVGVAVVAPSNSVCPI